MKPMGGGEFHSLYSLHALFSIILDLRNTSKLAKMCSQAQAEAPVSGLR